MSGQGNGGIAAIGLTEYRDVIGSLRYAAARPDTKNMKKTVPTLVAQVHDDTMTRPEDVQDIYDAIPVAEKSLYLDRRH